MFPFVEYTPDSSGVLYVARVGRDHVQVPGRCEFRRYDVPTQRDTLLTTLEDGEQCFIKAAGNRTAVLHEWHPVHAASSGRDGIERHFFAVDLETHAVRNLIPPSSSAGNFDVSPDGKYVAFDGGGRLFTIEL